MSAAGVVGAVDAELAEMVAVAEAVLASSSDGAEGLAALGWEPGDLDVVDDRRTTAAVFRAQGRTLAATPALGALVAHAALGDAGGHGPPAPSDRSMAAQARARGRTVELVGPAGMDRAGTVVVDLVGEGIFTSGSVRPLAAAVAALDPSAAVRATVERTELELVVPESRAAPARGRALAAARFAIAHEILGTCDEVMARAVEYADLRIQFGAPIASFQAVQHILAEAEVHRHALRAACTAAVRGSGFVGHVEGIDPVGLKALAGRTARRVMQATLQVFGAIGFTEEHLHHRYLRRALTLDGLFGSYPQLVAVLGGDALRLGRISFATSERTG